MESKAEEIARLRTFYDALPDGYLRDILAGVPDVVESMINDDFGYSIARPVADLAAERKPLQDELARLRSAVSAETAKLQDAQRALGAAHGRLAELSRQFSEWGAQADRAARRAAGQQAY